MDSEEYSTTYSKYLNDNTNNYLLNNGEVGLNELSIETMFTEIDASDLYPEALPLLLSNSLIAEVPDAVNKPDLSKVAKNGQISLLKSSQNKTTASAENIQLANKFIINADGDAAAQYIYEPNNTIDSSLNADTSKETIYLNNLVLQDVSNVQIINTDEIEESHIINDESNTVDQLVESTDYFTTVSAQKCNFCGYLCEKFDDIKLHLKEQHFTSISNEKETVSQPTNIQVQCVQKLPSVLNENISDKPKFTLFICSECNNGYANKDDLKDHMIKDHNLKICPSSNSESAKIAENSTLVKQTESKTQKSSKTYHLLLQKQQRALRKVKCSIKGCNLRFAKEEQCKRHEKCHVGDNKKQFKCTICNEKFSIWRICSSHLWKIHNIDLGLLTCPICQNFKSSSSGRILTHLSVHNEEKPFLCSDCGKAFKQLAQLKNHEILHKAPDELPNWSSMKLCEICQRFFANSKVLKKHVQTVHEKFKPFICNICGHKTSRKAMLELHLRQHTGAKPYSCHLCDYKTGDHNCLRRHTMRHAGEKKYTCPHCPYTSIQSASYKKHLLHKHPGKEGTYSCTQCPFISINSLMFGTHLKSHEIAAKSAGGSNGSEDGRLEDGSSFKESQNEQVLNDKTDNSHDIEDDETQSCFLSNNDVTEETVDTGGITIPAGLEIDLV